ncbi:MAG: phenylalanine 4-monooxygenase [Bdellovibrionota bacterium]
MLRNQNEFQSVPLPTLPLSIDVVYKAKSSYPIVPSLSQEGTIGKNILPPTYSQEQNYTWKSLFHKHQNLVKNNAYLCKEYISGLDLLQFPTEQVPTLAELSERLKATSGWQLIRVEGLVSAQKFFALLANKVFPCTDFIRHQDEIDYTPAPDTFHDQVGHLPMITHGRFAEFFHLFGLAGVAAKTEEEIMWFNRIYWFTTEFGLINPTVHSGNKYDKTKTQIYGAGIASSCGEILYSFSDQVKKLPFDLEVISRTEFDIHHMQDVLFEIESFNELEEKFKAWAIKNSFL